MVRFAACLLMVLAVAACASSEQESFTSRYSMTASTDNNMTENAGKPAPLDPQRSITDRDCHKPIDPPGGNLRCD